MENAFRLLTSALSTSLDIPVHVTRHLPAEVQVAVAGASASATERVNDVVIGTERYLYAPYDSLSGEYLVAGPFCRPGDPIDSLPVLDVEAEDRTRRTLADAALGLHHVTEEPRMRLELARQMELLSGAITAITSQLDLESVLRRIVDLAREVAGARYAALGVPNERNEIGTFITAGISAEQEALIGHPPVGRGLLGALLTRGQTIRVADLSTHPESEGFPPNHPPMKSFLGVPLISHGRILGNLYLTEKRFADEFSIEDERLVEVLARHAAVAIDNARLYAELREQQQRLRVILDQLPEAVLFAEPSPNRVTLINNQARALLGLDLEPPFSIETLADNLVLRDEAGELVPLDRRPLFRSLLTGERVVREEVTFNNPAGKRMTFLVNAVPLLDGDEMAASLVVFQDITAIKEADQLKDDFLSLVSHELRTPLTTIHGGTQMLMAFGDDLDEETRQELLVDMHNESSRLATLIHNMVQLAHASAGRLQLDLEPVLVRAVVTECVESLQDQRLDRDLRVEIESGLIAEADPNSVDEILRNLIQNAIKYTPESTPIDIGARCAGQMIEIYVRDYGDGIPEDEVPVIFDRFRRGSHGRSGRTAGMGLGLYLVKHLVEAQNGTIRLESPAGGGTCVTFSLPVASGG